MTATKRKGVRGGKDVLIAQQSRQNIRAEASKGNEKLVTIESSASIMDSEFDDTNLFSNNIFTGYDKIEGGPRASYGLKWGLIGDDGGHTSVFLGQRYRLKADSTFIAGSGLEENLSDFVARLNIFPNKYLDILYRTRLDKIIFHLKEMSFKLLLVPTLLNSQPIIYFSLHKMINFLGAKNSQDLCLLNLIEIGLLDC